MIPPVVHSIGSRALALRQVADRFLSGGLLVYIVSPQSWDSIKISKHHYAEEMADRGHRVVFINPPVSAKRVAQRLKKVRENLEVYSYRLPVPLIVKFRARLIFNWVMRRIARQTIHLFRREPDLVWDFDNTYTFADLRSFGGALRIFHPVDQVNRSRSSIKHADIVLSVSPAILARLDSQGKAMHIIPHGLSREFVAYGNAVLGEQPRLRGDSDCVVVGYVGNLAAAAMDREAMGTAIRENPQVTFEFFGPCSENDSGAGSGSGEWCEALRRSPNCVLHGRCTKQEILARAPTIDAWMVCYDYGRDINGGADSHKVLEYLATGAPVISSHLDAYRGTDLILMPPIKDNRGFGALFQSLLLSIRNVIPGVSEAERSRRIRFALDRSYGANLEKISRIAGGGSV